MYIGYHMYMKEFILAELALGPLHGYEISKRYAEYRQKKFVPSETYSTLHALEELGLIASTWEPGGLGMRKVYRLA